MRPMMVTTTMPSVSNLTFLSEGEDMMEDGDAKTAGEIASIASAADEGTTGGHIPGPLTTPPARTDNDVEEEEKIEEAAPPSSSLLRKDGVTFSQASLPISSERSSMLDVQHSTNENDSTTNNHDNNAFFIQRYFTDHYSLLVPSSTVKFRGSSAGSRVIENETNQMILEEHYDPTSGARTIELKRVNGASKGLNLLRGIYTIVCFLWVGIFLAFCFQILLNLVLDLAVLSGESSYQSQLKVPEAMAVVLGIVQFCFTFAEGMVIATRFVVDNWSGHFLMKNYFLASWGSVAVDWLFFAFFLMIPILVACIALFMRLDNWWVVTGLVWFGSISLFFVIFATYTTIYEISGAINFVRIHCQDKGDCSTWTACLQCMRLRQIRRYSGKKKMRYIARSISTLDEASSDENKKEDFIEDSVRTNMTLWTRITRWKFLSDTLHLFKVVDPPQKLHDLTEVDGGRPFQTKWTWSLERAFCRPSSTPRYIAIVDGPGAMTRNQIVSSFVCGVFGTLLICLLIAAVLTWYQVNAILIALVSLVLTIFLFCKLGRLFKIMQLVLSMKKHRENEHRSYGRDSMYMFAANDAENGSVPLGAIADSPTSATIKTPRRGLQKRRKSRFARIDESNTGLFVVSETSRITEASPVLCWTMMAIEIFVFYIAPLSVLFVQNPVVGGIYAVAVGVSGFRHYFNIVTVIEETGMKSVAKGKSRTERWAAQARLSDLVQKISSDSSKRVWLILLGVLAAVLLLFYIGTLTQADYSSNSTLQLTYLPPEFYYPPKVGNGFYPTCSFAEPRAPVLEGMRLVDFAFLTQLAYRTDAIVQGQLNSWFGSEVNVTDEAVYVNEYREASNTADLPVIFRFFRFEWPTGQIGIVSIRGSSTSADWLINNQIWQAAILVQAVRALLPGGGIFTPYLDDLVTMINGMQSSSVREASSYRIVTPFVELIKSDPQWAGVGVTGHSLGGGIALISGAQAGVQAVGISAPNAMLTRKSLIPKVSETALNQLTFNVVPDRDFVPRFDDFARSIQKIRCEAPRSEVAGCHSNLRSLCELMVSCGTINRPAICECNTLFGYPKPLTDGDADFDLLCASSNEAELAA